MRHPRRLADVHAAAALPSRAAPPLRSAHAVSQWARASGGRGAAISRTRTDRDSDCADRRAVQRHTPFEERLTGTVWYRSTYQPGLTADNLGDSLIVVTARPRTRKSAHGGGSVLVNTYELDATVFERLRERWTAWWRSNYEVIEIHASGT